MLMMDMRAAVERHAYAPGLRPKASQQSCLSLESIHHGRRKGKAEGTGSRTSDPSLAGVFVFVDDS